MPRLDQDDLNLIDRRRRESRSTWTERVGERSLNEQVRISGKLFHGEHWQTPSPTVGSATLNRTQNSIITGVAVQMETPIRPALRPHEGSGEREFFIKPALSEQLAGFLQKVDLGDALALEQIAGLLPIPESIGELLIAAGFDERSFHVSSDMTATRIAERTLLSEWSLSEADIYWWEHVLLNSVHGFAYMLFQWNPKTHAGELFNMPVKNVFVDPTHSWIRDADWAIVDLPIDAKKLEIEFPKARSAIRDAARTGSQQGAGNSTAELSTTFSRVDFATPHVHQTIMWERHSEYAMEPEEAISLDAVRETELEESNLDGVLVRVRALTRTDTGERTEPGATNWPKISAIRQVRLLWPSGEVLFDGRCPYWDMPLVATKNVPVLHRPWGQSEPSRLESLQHQINILIRALAYIALENQFPVKLWPKSLLAGLDRIGVTDPSRPFRDVGVPDAKWLQFMASKPAIAQYPSPKIEWMLVLLDRLLAEHDKLSGNVDVLQGNVPKRVESGRAIRSLQSAARGPLGFKSWPLHYSIRRLALLWLHAIIKWMPESHWQAYSKGYSVPALRSILSRLEDLDFIVEVQAALGGQDRLVREDKSELAVNIGAMSRAKFNENLGLEADGSIEVERRLREDAKMAAMQPAGGIIAPGGRVRP